MLHMFQAYKNTDDLEMRKLNNALSKHAATSGQLTDALQKYQFPASLEGDSIAELRAELKSEINSLKQSTHHSSQDPVAFEEQFTKISASVYTQSQMNRALQADIGELVQWKADIEEGNAKLPKSALPADLDSIQRDLNSNHEQCQQAKADIENLRQECSTVNSKIESVKTELGACDLRKNIDEMRASMDQAQLTMNRLSRAENDAFNMIKNIETQMKVGAEHLEHRLWAAISGQNAELKNFEQQLNRLTIGSHAVAEVPSTGKAAVATDSTASPRAADIPTINSPDAGRLAPVVPAASASNISSPQVESSIEQRLNAFGQAISDLQDKNQQLETTCTKLHTGISPVIQKGAEWVETVERWMQATQTLATGLRSLELRYNNINTEPMIKKMAHAFQEMYPSVSTLIEQIQALQEAEKTRTSEITSLKTQIDQLKLDENGARLELVDQTLTGRMVSLREELTGQYEKHRTQAIQRFQSLQEVVDRRWQEFDTRISTRLQSLPDSAANSSHQQFSYQIKLWQEAQQAQTKLLEQRLSGRIASLQGAHSGLSEQYVSDQIQSLLAAQETQREQFEEQISTRINALQEAQKAESTKNAENLEAINLLKGRFDIQQTTVGDLAELGDTHGEDITAIHEQMQPLEALKSEVADVLSQVQGQGQRIDSLESPIQTIRTRLDGFKAFGTTAEIEACCDQLQYLKREDIVSKVTRLNDLLSERIGSYHAEVEGDRASGAGKPETQPEASRSAANGAGARPKPRESTQTRSDNARPQKAAVQPQNTNAQSNPTTKAQQPALRGSINRSAPASTGTSTSNTPSVQTAQTGAKRKRPFTTPSESNKPGNQVLTASQIGSPALSGSDQSSRKKKKADAQKKERRRQSQMQQ